MKTIFEYILKILALMVVGLILLLSVKGDKGNPIIKYQLDYDTSPATPYEASNTTARYALTEAIVKGKTFFLSEDLAKFSAPDIAESRGKFISLFTPGVSFIAVPLYLAGQHFGLPQLITFLTVPIFAIINFFLIAKIARKLGVNNLTSYLSGFLFLFGTNAFSYAHTLSQHHITVTIILLMLTLAFGKKNLFTNVFFGFLFGFGLLVDIPNLFLVAPITIYYYWKQIDFKKEMGKVSFSLKLSILGLVFGLAPMIFLFAFYNYKTTGSYTTLAQSLGRTKLLSQNAPAHRSFEGTEAEGDVPSPTKSKLPFNSRKQLSGFYTLLVSNERAWVFYSPVVFVGLFGLVLAYRQKELRDLAVIALSICSINMLIYAMFGDPWGGWAFGPRYLIPSAAIAALGIGLIVERFRRNLIFIILFVVISIYSISVNTVGVLTTSMIAPKVEAVNLPEPIPYTYEYNLQFIKNNVSSSLLYNLYLSNKISVQSFVTYFATVLSVFFLATYFLVLIKKEKS